MRAAVKRMGAAVAALAMVAGACSSSPSNPAAAKGSSVLTDPAGDAANALNALGKKPTKVLGAADILGVRFDADGKALRVRIAVADSPADHIPLDNKEGPDWILQLWPGPATTGAPAYFVAIVRDGVPRVSGTQLLGWRLSVCPGIQVCSGVAAGSQLAIVGDEIRAQIPFTTLSKLGNPFSWVALSYWNESTDPVQAWSDYVPDGARPAPGATTYASPNVRAIFPPKSK